MVAQETCTFCLACTHTVRRHNLSINICREIVQERKNEIETYLTFDVKVSVETCSRLVSPQTQCGLQSGCAAITTRIFSAHFLQYPDKRPVYAVICTCHKPVLHVPALRNPRQIQSKVRLVPPVSFALFSISRHVCQVFELFSYDIQGQVS